MNRRFFLNSILIPSLALCSILIIAVPVMAGNAIIFTDSGQSLGYGWNLVLGDLDSDGDLDAWVGNGGGKIYINDGTGIFSDSGQSLGGESEVYGTALGDLDGDGDLDAFVATDDANEVYINDGTGIFSDSGQRLDIFVESSDVALGDLDGDGYLDAFVTSTSNNKVWLNDGTGVFTDSGQSLGNSFSYGVALGDVDGDSDLDAFVANNGSPNKVWLNNGTGVFTDSGQNLGIFDSTDVALGDLDGDGDLDAFATNESGQANKVWVNNGGAQGGTIGVFTDSGQELTNTSASGAALGDLDSDGDLDAFVTDEEGDAKIWLNDGTGTFTDGGHDLGDEYSYDVALGDLDSDGDLDILVGGDNRVWINNTPLLAIERPSVNSEGIESEDDAQAVAISADGRYVVFSSEASNLVADDTNGENDVFVHDRQTGETTRVSVDSNGNEGNSESGWSISISSDGRFIAFDSYADNLVAGDENDENDVFVHDRQTGETTRVSVNSNGNEGDANSGNVLSISADGRYVVFSSEASNLVADDTNDEKDVFVHDRQTGQTLRVSVDSAGNQGNWTSYSPTISSDGRYVVFVSAASNLVANDTNGFTDIFLHDTHTGETRRISVASEGNEGNGYSRSPAISPGGQYVVFSSLANNLVSDDTNDSEDVFLHSVQTGETTRVSVDSNGNQGNGESRSPTISVISDEGHYVAFISSASNLIADDTNGVSDVFLRHLQTGKMWRLSTTQTGGEPYNYVDDPQWGYRVYDLVLAGKGTYLLYISDAENIIPTDENGADDAFVVDWSLLTGYTPAGTSVKVEPVDQTGAIPIKFTFTNVSIAGYTSVTAIETLPPEGSYFNVSTIQEYHNITTTATFSGDIIVDIAYDPEKITGNEEDLRLYHFKDGFPIDMTLDEPGNPDTVNHRIKGVTDEFCIFATVLPSGPSNNPPVAAAGSDQTVEAGLGCSQTVTVDGSGSTDPDSTLGTNDDIVSFDWYEGDDFLVSGETIEYDLSLGTHTITLVVTDSAGETDEDEVIITVHDTTPPEVTVSASKNSLWPPNHKMIDVGLSFEVSDSCDQSLDVAIEVTSDEPTATAPGAGGPKHAPDAEITDDNRVLLRAERSGKGDGRVYEITVTATDSSGNNVSSSVSVKVNKSKKKEAVDSGQNYDATEIN